MRVSGEVAPPGDKSVTHRALILAALSHARVTVHGALTADDARSTARVLRQLGVRVGSLRRGRRVVVVGRPWVSP
jgi:3-phosphoshikimate 1-carboxyvinyltransferase